MSYTKKILTDLNDKSLSKPQCASRSAQSHAVLGFFIIEQDKNVTNIMFHLLNCFSSSCPSHHRFDHSYSWLFIYFSFFFWFSSFDSAPCTHCLSNIARLLNERIGTFRYTHTLYCDMKMWKHRGLSGMVKETQVKLWFMPRHVPPVHVSVW